MNKTLQTGLSLLTMISPAAMAQSQGMKLGEVIIISNPVLKSDVKPEDFQTYIVKEVVLSWNKPGTSMHLFRADRGDRKDQFLIACSVDKSADRKAIPAGNPFIGAKRLADFLNNPSYTEYHLIGADKLRSLPAIGILGIHYIKVKPERSAEFEQFVVEKLHPAVAQLLPDMHLLYYKAAAGEQAGTYITIFAIESPAARHKYWPAGAPETEILKQAFQPLKALAAELGPYLVEDSYLPESGGAAAYFESKEWTDFIHYSFLK